MKKFKRIFLAIITLALGLTLASCKNEDARNTSVPYGTIASQKDIVEGKLSAKTYYNKLRSKSYDTFLKELKYQIYSEEIATLTKLLYNETLTDADKKVLSYTSEAADEETINYLYARFNKLVGNTLASSIYGTYSLSSFNNKTEEAKELSVAKYVQAQARKGVTVDPSTITYTIDEVSKTILVDYTKLDKEIVKEVILTQAQILQAEKELYNQTETILDDEEKEISNKNYLFGEAKLRSTYERSLMTYGTYQAVIIQFNSYKDAKAAVAKVTTDPATDPAKFYTELYNAHYGYRNDNVTSIEDDKFTYVVNEDKDQLSEISSGVYTLVTETLEDGDFLTEPRNINNKYVMAYRISTSYEISGTNEQVEYDDLTETKKDEINLELKKIIVESNGSSYVSTAFNNLLENNTIKIYDPYLEYKFEYAYPDYYDTVTESNNDVLFSVGEFNYKVDDFYALMNKLIGQTTILEHFSLEYAYQIKDEYVGEETEKTNSEALETAIKAFEKNQNTTYPAEIGLETFLLASYGYTSEEDVLKYYYSASSALSSYKSEIVSEDWVQPSDENKDLNVMSDYAKKVINALLTSGNPYNELFSIDIDHILINLDDNGDGNPDDPNTFLNDNKNVNPEEFQASVAALAQAIYTEAAWLVKKGNTTFEAFQFIVKQYNKGEALYSIENKTWDDYKTYNFLLTAEQLASSGNITQNSVSNFVVPFADYVKTIASQLEESKIDEDNGSVVIINNGQAEIVEENASSITFDSLCATNYGFHLLVVNKIEDIDGLKDTSTKYNTHFFKISSGEDKENEEDDVYVTISTVNENETKATAEQLYVYLTQKELSITSSLDDEITAVLGDIYDDAIEVYTGINFQTLVLIDTLIAENQELASLINVERAYYVNVVTGYDSESPYLVWCNDTSVFRK